MKSLNSLVRMLILTLFLFFANDAAADNCESCQIDVGGNFEVLSSYDASFSRKICYACINYAPQCYVCKLPSLKGAVRSEDQRVFCARDHAAGIFAHDGMNQIAYQTINDLNRAFYRFNMSF